MLNDGHIQVGTVEAAKKAAEAGVDAVIVQGVEAGGHVIGQVLFYRNLCGYC
jgi:NAD(P)H-dependent flavin oxidoreductase YrpB (nitropropane dioxygenase family)